MQLKPINQQVVAVVGASSGVGRETALQFAHRGAQVVVSTHPVAKWSVLAGTALGGVALALLAAQAFKNGGQI